MRYKSIYTVALCYGCQTARWKPDERWTEHCFLRRSCETCVWAPYTDQYQSLFWFSLVKWKIIDWWKCHQTPIFVRAPQGCVFSPSLFILYTYDCTPRHLETSIVKHADDTTIIIHIINNEGSYNVRGKDWMYPSQTFVQKHNYNERGTFKGIFRC